MDSGPNGDSFLAPRMLPDLGEGGDYRWPAFCTYMCPAGSVWGANVD
jgi:hypothetical protein